MKKIIVIVVLFMVCTTYAQNQSIRGVSPKGMYENVFYRSTKNPGKDFPFKVNKVNFSTSFKSSKGKNIYQVSVYGTVNNKKEEVHYNAASIEEIEYYAKVFKGRFKRLLLFEHDYNLGSKKHHDTSIVVEY
ncbi:hypothetical protein [Seonamhaeicola maritimus]|uniref:hypothetical protein n=1 Tax=Seonamhaeicola maritimus TaxID=2591822 RepID=UPI002493D0F3|nr:hypothetical protein [Seonamhaeicola maritimus]